MAHHTSTDVKITTTPVKFQNVAIIGSAGRGNDSAKMNKPLFEAMCQEARRVISEDWKLRPDHDRLVSGGAAWSDHVAIQIAKGGVFGDIALHLPCKMDMSQNRAVDTGTMDWKTNP